MKLKYLVFIILLLSSFLTVNESFANKNLDIVLNYPVINSTSKLYPVKRLWEKGVSHLLFSKNSKVSYNKELLKERLSELKYVLEKKEISEIQKSSERFAYQVGIYSEKLSDLNDKNKINKALEEFKSYSKSLVVLRDLYEANSSYWLLVQQDIDTLNIISDKIKN